MVLLYSAGGGGSNCHYSLRGCTERGDNREDQAWEESRFGGNSVHQIVTSIHLHRSIQTCASNIVGAGRSRPMACPGERADTIRPLEADSPPRQDTMDAILAPLHHHIESDGGLGYLLLKSNMFIITTRTTT